MDERLRQLIDLALANNRDLRQTALAIDKARAQYRVQRAGLFPAINASAGTTAKRTPAELSGSGQAVTSRSHSVDLGVSGWEIDLFGRLQSLRDQALESYLASEDTLRSTRISLVAEVAAAYLTLSADSALLAISRDTLTSQQSSLTLTRKRVELGVGSELELRQIETSVETARRDVATYTAQVAVDRNALVLLAGAPLPDSLLPPAGLDSVTALRPLPAGLPSTVLQERPDVLAAERALRAANASIGAARAAFFPRISLTATAGSASTSLGGLFAAGSGAWTFIPQVSLPIFDGGANRANLQVAEADRNIALARYEQTVQSAFREVADALAQRATVDTRLDAQQKLVDATAASYRLSEARYLKGVDSYLSTLDAQRSLYAARQNLVSLKLAAASNSVTLYKVLGGGALSPASP
ncbi:MAG: efflux transporter outer membrane subunit [Zoogloea sp.]|uniref:efflux transporter outer membrane subunit n=1 Tax=Zoogloea sp. TaxID=49181 RepID=UPI00262D0B22|nr:efflux transporter outer membrane subunit [Zoogloea sp.]MDD2989505.1 efflux transporter outer membrane subunit [Zoogloea sp.]